LARRWGRFTIDAPVDVPADETFVEFAVGSNHVWGQLAAPAGEGFLDLDAGLNYTCAVRANHQVVCWGAYHYDPR
jgi:hypothetical protein